MADQAALNQLIRDAGRVSNATAELLCPDKPANDPALAAMQAELVDARINIVRVLEGMAGDRVKTGAQGSPWDELALWRAKEALAEARIKQREMGG